MITLKKFDKSYIGKAAGLLSQQQKTIRKTLVDLPNNCEDIRTAEKTILQLFQKENSSGVVAVDNGKLVGYLFGSLMDDPDWGKWAWIYLGGHALAQGADPGVYADMYAQAAGSWVKREYFTHMAELSPAGKPVLDVWYRLGFGHQQDYGLKKLQIETNTALPADIEIRRGQEGDENDLEGMAALIADHQRGAPAWVFAPESYIAAITEGYRELASDKDATVWLACTKKQIAGFHVYYDNPASETDLRTPAKCNYLSIAATKPEYRGRKIGSALTKHGFKHAYESGYRYCMTDWRTTNLLSSRFWPQQGFNVIMHRLSRTIDTQTLNSTASLGPSPRPPRGG